MAAINYKHLHYFWAVAKAGSITRAGERLHLTPQTISGQLTLFEEVLGHRLFDRVGRRLELTDAGRIALGYADEIFSLGQELQETLHNQQGSRTLVFRTHVTEITAALRRRSVAETLREITQIVRHWSGGTDIGAALGCLNRGVIREGAASSTVAIIISDGYDNGSIERIAEEMKALQRQVSSVVWINPMYGASTFQVRAAGMRAALPFVDHFLPAFDARSLRVLVRALALI